MHLFKSACRLILFSFSCYLIISVMDYIVYFKVFVEVFIKFELYDIVFKRAYNELGGLK